MEIDGIVESVWITDIKSNDNMVVLGFGLARDQSVNLSVNDENQIFNFNGKEGLAFATTGTVISLDRTQGLTLQITSGDKTTDVITLLEPTQTNTETGTGEKETSTETFDDKVKAFIQKNIDGTPGLVTSEPFTKYPTLEIDGIVENVWVTGIDDDTEKILMGAILFKDETVSIMFNGVEHITENYIRKNAWHKTKCLHCGHKFNTSITKDVIMCSKCRLTFCPRKHC